MRQKGEYKHMKLACLLERSEYRILKGSAEREIEKLVNNSNEVTPGCMFICIVGAKFDGHTCAASAARDGAAAVVVEDGRLSDEKIAEIPDTCTVVSVPDTRYAMALIAAAWYEYPAEKIPVIGITGTKGKTTTTYMVRSILENAGYKVGLIGTIETIIGKTHVPSKNTTPESTLVQKYLHEMVEAGCTCAVMEVSSQALMMHRTAGIMFEIGVFTNLSPDHIGEGEHKDFAEYLEMKSRLFKQCRIAVANADDAHTKEVLAGCVCPVETYGITTPDADIRAVNIEHIHRPGYLGVTFDVVGKASFPVELDIPGLFSIYNALTAISICRHFDIPVEAVKKALKAAFVKGRIEMIKVSDEFTLMIDYAHNAMALESLLSTLRDYHPNRIVCLFGCGGNRSKDRRFEMGEVSGRMADFTIITSDNPRFEEPEDIIADIVTGIKRTDGKYITIINRKEAIAYAIDHGQPGDIIVLAGKGHEDYQEIRGVKYPMDERVLIKEILDERALR